MLKWDHPLSLSRHGIVQCHPGWQWRTTTTITCSRSLLRLPDSPKLPTLPAVTNMCVLRGLTVTDTPVHCSGFFVCPILLLLLLHWRTRERWVQISWSHFRRFEVNLVKALLADPGEARGCSRGERDHFVKTGRKTDGKWTMKWETGQNLGWEMGNGTILGGNWKQ